MIQWLGNACFSAELLGLMIGAFAILHASSYTCAYCDCTIAGATIAGVYRASNFVMAPLYALVWGVGQTIVVIFMSFSRILATL